MPRHGSSDRRSPIEPSSDASLWEDIDDAFDGISTPPLPPQQHTASDPVTIPDSTADISTMKRGLELDLFPSGRDQNQSSSSGLQNPSRPDLDATEPFSSQTDCKATQYRRDEWLISAGQKQPNDLVQDYFPDARSMEKRLLESLSRKATGGNTMASRSALAQAGHGPSNASNLSKRGRSSLLDQLDEICSPSSSGSSIDTRQAPIHVADQDVAAQADRAPTRKSAAGSRQPLQPVIGTIANGKSLSASQESDEFAALDILDMPGSPPSQLVSHITLIKDMPPEKQELYRRLAFGNSSDGASTANVGVTARGKRGKTWQTTWQDDADGPSESLGGIGSADRLNGASSSNSSRLNGVSRGAAANSNGAGRGRKSSGSSASKRKGGSQSSKSSSSTSRSHSRFFAAKAARGGWRNRARGRGRGR